MAWTSICRVSSEGLWCERSLRAAVMRYVNIARKRPGNRTTMKHDSRHGCLQEREIIVPSLRGTYPLTAFIPRFKAVGQKL